MTFTEAVDNISSIIKSEPDCRACGMGAACCGCPEHRAYDARLAEFKRTIDNEDITNRLMKYAYTQMDIVEIENKISKLQKRLDSKKTKLEDMAQPLKAQFQDTTCPPQTTTEAIKTQVHRCKITRI